MFTLSSLGVNTGLHSRMHTTVEMATTILLQINPRLLHLLVQYTNASRWSNRTSQPSLQHVSYVFNGAWAWRSCQSDKLSNVLQSLQTSMGQHLGGYYPAGTDHGFLVAGLRAKRYSGRRQRCSMLSTQTPKMSESYSTSKSWCQPCDSWANPTWRMSFERSTLHLQTTITCMKAEPAVITNQYHSAPPPR